jgi:hypothetical protein
MRAYNVIPIKEEVEPGDEVVEKDLDLIKDELNGAHDRRCAVEDNPVDLAGSGTEKVINPSSSCTTKFSTASNVFFS